MHIISRCTLICMLILTALSDDPENGDQTKSLVTANVKVPEKCDIASCNFSCPDEPVLEVPPLRENKKANLTCSTPSSCPPKISWWIKIRGGNMTEMKGHITTNNTESFNISTLTFTPSSDHHNATVWCNVSYGNEMNITTNKTIEVSYVKTLRILGSDKVQEGNDVICTVDSHPASSEPLWIFTENTTELKNVSGRSLAVENIQHDGEFLCVVAYKNKLLITSIYINGNTSDRVNGTSIGQLDVNQNDTKNNTAPPVIAGFLELLKMREWQYGFTMGMATSAVVFFVLLCCWVSCKRTKRKAQTAPPDSTVNLKMKQTLVDLTLPNEQTVLHNQGDAEMSNTQMESTGEEEENEAGEAKDEAGPGDVDYASIDYSLLKKKSPEEEENKSSNTDYAEIKRDKKRQRASENEHEHTEV